MPGHSDDITHHYDTARIEAFSDGVFAIAITLLIIEIGVPHVEGDQSLASALRHLWPSYLGYALSFITIGIMWMNHHHMFRDIERTDHWLIVLNVLLLMCISFLPFSTALLVAYLQDDELPRAMFAYATSLTVTAISFNAMWLYAAFGGRFVDSHVSQARLRARTIRYLPAPVLYAAAIALSFINPWASFALIAALTVLFLIPLPE
jgi:uncharacterized membrane protein